MNAISPYLVNMNHKNHFRNLVIKPRFQRFQSHIDKNSASCRLLGKTIKVSEMSIMWLRLLGRT